MHQEKCMEFCPHCKGPLTDEVHITIDPDSRFPGLTYWWCPACDAIWIKDATET